MEFEGKVILITGASSGIGAATAINFAKQSAKLALVARNENNLRRIALYCEKFKGNKPLLINADVTIKVDVERIIEETIQHYGRLDVLVNNAGVCSLGGIKNTTLEKFDIDFSTNIRAVYHLTMLTVPHLILSKGNIVNVSCLSSMQPNTSSLAYNCSKAALDQFTKCLALELACDNVRVNAVNPGFVKTNLLKGIGLTEEQMEHYVQNMAGNVPLKKTVESEEVANLIMFLASDKAKSITGTLQVIDGGSALR